MEETQLSHGCVESPYSHTDVLSQNVMGGVEQDSFEAAYTVPHDNQRGDGICTQAQVADVIYQMYGVECSEQFGYKGQKQKYDGNLLEGSSIKSALEFDRAVGLPKKSLVPTDDTRKSFAEYISSDFSAEAWADAQNHKLPGYYRITDLSLEGLIREGQKSKYGIAIMIRVGSNWYTDTNGKPSWDPSKISPLRSGKPYTGAHATKIVKLCADGSGVIRNTWGDHRNPIRKDGTGIWCNDGDIDFHWDTIKDDIAEAWGFLDQPVTELFSHLFQVPLKYGMTNSFEVSCLQRMLKRLGFYSYSITGNYFDITAKAVLDFQRSKGIMTGDGMNVGPATRASLNGI